MASHVVNDVDGAVGSWLLLRGLLRLVALSLLLLLLAEAIEVLEDDFCPIYVGVAILIALGLRVHCLLGCRERSGVGGLRGISLCAILFCISLASAIEVETAVCLRSV